MMGSEPTRIRTDLRADGWMQPDGPTDRRLAADLGTVAASLTAWPPVPKLKGDRQTPNADPSWRTKGQGRLGDGRLGQIATAAGESTKEFHFKVAAGSRIPSTVSGRVTALGTVYGRPRTAGRAEPTYRYVEVTTPDRFATRTFLR